MAQGFIPTACTGFVGTYSLWMDTLPTLDIVSSALDFPQSNVPFSFCGVDEGWGGKLGRGNGRRRKSGNLY